MAFPSKHVSWKFSVGLIMLAFAFEVLEGQYDQYRYRKLKRHAVITHAIITSGRPQRRSSRGHETDARFDYIFFVGQRRVESNAVYYGIPGDSAFRFIDHNIVVAYDSTDSQNNRILLWADDFSLFNLPYPDSMKWAKQYLP